MAGVLFEKIARPLSLLHYRSRVSTTVALTVSSVLFSRTLRICRRQ
jgi:hypothetical protein